MGRRAQTQGKPHPLGVTGREREAIQYVRGKRAVIKCEPLTEWTEEEASKKCLRGLLFKCNLSWELGV